MFKKRDWKKLKNLLKKEKELKEHYSELFAVSVEELKFEKLRNKHLLSVIEEIRELARQGVHSNFIRLLVENAFERDAIDRNIHNHLIAKNSGACSARAGKNRCVDLLHKK